MEKLHFGLISIISLVMVIIFSSAASWAEPAKPFACEIPVSSNQFKGEVTQNGKSVPFTLILSPTEKNGTFEGTIEWPTLNSIHRIAGKRPDADSMTFTEVEYIKRGNASLNNVYTLKRTPDGKKYEGTWQRKDGPEKGTVWFKTE